MLEEKPYCFTCSNEGFYDRTCDECFMPPIQVGVTKIAPEKLTKLDVEMDKVLIPESYQGIEWDSEIFWTSHPELIARAKTRNISRLPELEVILKRMDKIQTQIKQGIIPRVSTFVILQPNMSKSVWAFSCMRFALASGLSVAPYFDSIEVASMMGAFLKNPSYRLYGNVTFDDYVSRDILFMSITKTEHRKNAYQVIRDVLDKRSRMGKPTFILSEYTLEEISAWDDTGNFMESMRNGVHKFNPHQYPEVLEYLYKGENAYAK